SGPEARSAGASVSSSSPYGGQDTCEVRRRTGLALAAASAVLLFCAGEPVRVAPLAWVAMVPLLVAVLHEERLRHAEAKRRRDLMWSWLYGLVFGAVYFAIHLGWIFIFGWMAWTALTAWLALEASVGTLVAAVVRRSRLAPVLVAGAFVGVELWRDRWPYGGFPWGTVGTTQGAVPGVRYLAGTIGVYGLSFLCVFLAAVVAHRIVHGKVPWSSVAVVGSVLAVFCATDV